MYASARAAFEHALELVEAQALVSKRLKDSVKSNLAYSCLHGMYGQCDSLFDQGHASLVNALGKIQVSGCLL